MADTVTVAGHQVPKGYLIGGGAAVAGLAAISWYRQKRAAAAAPAAAASPGPTAAGDQYPPDGTTGNPSDPYSTDPGTGVTYGDEAGAGYVGNGTANFGGGGFYGAGTGTEGPGTFTSNAYWTQYCEQLMGSSGNDAISAALGAYIAGTVPPAGGVTIIEQAIAIAGYPPVAGSGGFPPSIQTGPSGSGGTGTPPAGTGAVTVTVPGPGPTTWQPVTFPSQDALTQFLNWWGAPIGPNGQAVTWASSKPPQTRSAVNAELRSLGATGLNGAPLLPPTFTGNPYDNQ